MANNYRNLNRPGTRSTVNADPRLMLEDLNTTFQTLDPNATPLHTLSDIIGKGAPPKALKVQTMQYNSFDNYDFCSAATIGTNNDTRFASMTIDQSTRPDVANYMYYYPQDKFYIVATGQTVEVVITPVASIPLANGTEFAMQTTTLTGSTTTRSTAGTVVVRNIEAQPILPFTTSDIIYLGRTIREGQAIQAQSTMRDLVYDMNYVEHKEKVFAMTDDQKDFANMRSGVLPDWTFQQREMFKEFKIEVEYNALFSERAFDDAVPNNPTRHMRGLVNAIKTNVGFYNPYATTDFEKMFNNFLWEQGFRYKGPSGMNKVAICGGMFLKNFNEAFAKYRQTMGISDKQIGTTVGFDINKYVLPGGMSISLHRSEALRQNTPLENWCFIIDPALMKWRVAKDYASRMYNLANEREQKIMVEWQGTVSWELEQAHALLRTPGTY